MVARQRRLAAVLGLGLSLALALTGCGAGSRTGAKSATAVTCDFEKPKQPVTVNVLAYNSSAIDPFTNTMVKSCSKNDVTVKHDPIDFAGQVQKTQATLSGEKGTYDLVETYSFIVPTFGEAGKLRPLDDLYAKYQDEYQLGDLNAEMLETMSYDGKLYAVPMQAQMFVMAYRQDVFDKLGLEPPKTFAELRTVAQKIQGAGEIEHPVALPWNASSDLGTAYDAALGSLGTDLVDKETLKPNFDTPQAKQAFKELKSLMPYMDPQVTTFDQPKVQQQMTNGTAAIAIMFSGRMNDLVQESTSEYFDKFAFAPPPTVGTGGKQYNTLSVDGWSIPKNAQADPDLLFQMIGASVSEDASKAALPAAYPAREGMVDDDSSPYAVAANDAIGKAPPVEPFPYTSLVNNAVLPYEAQVLTGKISVEEGTQKMQEAAEKVMADFR